MGAQSIRKCFDMIRYVDENKIEGGIVDSGVAEGGTSAMMALTNRISNFQLETIFI